MKKTVAVAMSGGVDSSVVADILKEKGYEIFGITMLRFENESEIDTKDVVEICNQLGIKHYFLDVRREFKEQVIKYFINSYKEGKTPNPCVFCNRYIKFGKLIDFAMDKGADLVATGHYACYENGNLYIGEDEKKDQAYFLSQVRKEYLEKMIFPLGSIKKDKTRELAENISSYISKKKDSQEICFVPDDDYKKYLQEATNGEINKKGKIIHKNGEILGEHSGLYNYTIGQRKGMGISYREPIYVIGFNMSENVVIVGSNGDLFAKSLICEKINLLGISEVEELDNIRCYIKTRSRDRFHKGVLKIIDDNQIKIEFDEKVRAITPGQVAVFYSLDEKMVLGSGYIKEE